MSREVFVWVVLLHGIKWTDERFNIKNEEFYKDSIKKEGKNPKSITQKCQLVIIVLMMVADIPSLVKEIFEFEDDTRRNYYVIELNWFITTTTKFNPFDKI